jgi:hypothetical protein
MGEADQELHRMTSSVGCESAYWGSTQSFSDGQASFVWREPVGCGQHISAFTRSGGLKNIQAVGSVRLDNGDALRKEFGLPAFSTDLQILVHAFERNGRQGFPKIYTEISPLLFGNRIPNPFSAVPTTLVSVVFITLCWVIASGLRGVRRH